MGDVGRLVWTLIVFVSLIVLWDVVKRTLAFVIEQTFAFLGRWPRLQKLFNIDGWKLPRWLEALLIILMIPLFFLIIWGPIIVIMWRYYSDPLRIR
jgi:hypothetical protein